MGHKWESMEGTEKGPQTNEAGLDITGLLNYQQLACPSG